MKTWEVTVPITGYCVVSVEAEDKETAIKQAVNSVSFDNIECCDAITQIVIGYEPNGVIGYAQNKADAKDIS